MICHSNSPCECRGTVDRRLLFELRTLFVLGLQVDGCPSRSRPLLLSRYRSRRIIFVNGLRPDGVSEKM